MKIDLSEHDLERIVREALINKGFNVEDITFNIGTKCEGYGMAEHQVTYFKGCTVSCKD